MTVFENEGQCQGQCLSRSQTCTYKGLVLWPQSQCWHGSAHRDKVEIYGWLISFDFDVLESIEILQPSEKIKSKIVHICDSWSTARGWEYKISRLDLVCWRLEKWVKLGQLRTLYIWQTVPEYMYLWYLYSKALLVADKSNRTLWHVTQFQPSCKVQVPHKLHY